MPIKSIKFDYFQVTTPIDNGKEIVDVLYDLSPLLTGLQAKDPQTRTYKYSNEEARLQNIKQADKDVWELHFMRIRKHLLPVITKDTGEYEYLSLNDNEGLGEEVSALYDKKRCILMIQRNRNSLSPSGILEYFNKVQNKHQLMLNVIPLKDMFSKLNKDNIFRKIDVSFAGIKNSMNSSGNSICGVINLANHFEAVNAHISFSVGNRKKPLSNKIYDDLKNLVTRANTEKDIKKLEVSVQENEDTKVEVFDLVVEKLYDSIDITYSRSEPITHERIIKYMLDKYIDRKDTIDDIIGNK